MIHAFTILTRLFAALLALVGLVSCGGGGVSGPAPVTDPTRITILPAAATLFAGVPTTFVISGGTGSYIVSSSNQAVVPVAGSISGNTLVVTPNAVGAETGVTLTVRDTGTTPLATATLTVRPGTVSNEITVAPSSTQGLNCAPAVCSGGDALVTAVLSQGGVPLAGRAVRFDAISGDFRFVTSTTGSGTEVLETSQTVASDQAGRATARVRVIAGAANQTALLQVTDLSTGSFQRTSFVISQATGTSPGFFASPSSVTFQGRRLGECAGSDISATFYVFGGTPPYVISNTLSTLIVRPEVLGSSGSGFTVTPTGSCIGLPGFPVIIRDAAGRTTTANVANITGTEAIPALSASPSTVNISSCDATASVQVAGGRSSTYFVASGSDALIATISGSTVTISRRNPSGPAAASGSIGISDGTSVVTVSVTISGRALNACPSPGFAASPSSVTLTDCTSAAQVVLSGGSGTYVASSSNGSVTATVSGSILSIRRANPSGAFGGGTVTVSDGNTSVPITVNASGAGAAGCGSGNTTLSVSPTTVNLTTCSSAEVVQIFGGSGTYTVIPSNSSLTATISGTVLSIRRTNPSSSSSGGTVTVNDGSASAVVAVNTSGEGAGACPTPVRTSPSLVTLTDCNATAVVTVSGGSGTYTATPSSTSLTTSVSGNVLSIRRTNPSSAFSSGTVTVSDGSSTSTVTVNATGNGASACPNASQGFAASTTTVELTSCTNSAQVTLSGGNSASYSAASQSSAVTATTSGSTVTIRRAVPSGTFTTGTVVVSDGNSSITVTVNGVGAGTGSCSAGAAVSTNPTDVTVNSCTSTPSVIVSGGNGNYSVATSNTAITVSFATGASSNILTIRRASGPAPTTNTPCVSTARTGTQCVTVSDGASSTEVGVTLTGTATGTCP